MAAISYQQQSMVGATGVELILALYDAAIRSLYRAREAVLEDDTFGRRFAVKKVIDILLYLQARLRPDVGGFVAGSLADFYSAMFTLTLEASHEASMEGFEDVIRCVQNVRDAWAIVALDPEAGRVLPRELRTREEKFAAAVPVPEAVSAVHAGTQRWSA